MERQPMSEQRMCTCIELEQQLDSYLEDLLSEYERSRFELHTLACAHCRKLVEEFQLIRDTARTLVDSEIPSGVRERLRSRLAQETSYRYREEGPSLRLVK